MGGNPSNFRSIGVAGALFAAIAAVQFFSSAQAGETVYFKSGAVNLPDISVQLFSDSISSPGESEKSFRIDVVRYYVVQFDDRITPGQTTALLKTGAVVLRYLPDDAVIVRAASGVAGLLKVSTMNIRSVYPYVPEWKVSPGLFRREGDNKNSNILILVSVFAGHSSKTVRAEIGRLPGVVLSGAGGRDIAVEAPPEMFGAIAGVEGVEWMQEMPVFETFVLDAQGDSVPPPPKYEYTGYESGTRIMGFDAAWSRGYKGDGQIVGVADTGLDSGDPATVHQDLRDRLIKGFPVGIGTKSWEDPHGHGTHVMGSVLGNGALSDGWLKGGAHQARLIAEGCWSPIIENFAPGTNFEKIFGTAYNEGARIHSNSWGNANSPGEYDSIASKVDDYIWNHPDLFVVFAAGNSGVDLNRDGRIDDGSLCSPGTSKNVLTVGASENLVAKGGNQKQHFQLRDGERKWGAEPVRSDKLSDNPGGIAAFSSRGPAKDGRIKPDVVAPGTNIVSVRSRHPKADKLWGEFNADYLYAGGTSMATPLTAGAAAVARQFLQSARGIKTPSGAIVKTMLMHSAKDLFPGQYGAGDKQEIPAVRPNSQEGYGRVDMDALTALDSASVVVDDLEGVALSEKKEIARVLLKGGQSLRVTMCYTDAPAAASAARSLVNDLDLVVDGPDGKSITKEDRVNNCEMIERTGLAAGEYRVFVSGVNIPKTRENGKLPFAVAVN
ncbi:MAG: hypothetical protein A2583_04390 [Bdellovibrionales bacterium RIFOXYD1_FULL_53_11]|nr:MAG: hypothetical protein A2583_04390 [Bdellovibrionales bacterium RIFOXYD1_FULL_53_11]